MSPSQSLSKVTSARIFWNIKDYQLDRKACIYVSIAGCQQLQLALHIL